MDAVMTAVWRFFYALLRILVAVWSFGFLILVFVFFVFVVWSVGRMIIHAVDALRETGVNSKQHTSNSARAEEGGMQHDDECPEALEKLPGEHDGREGPG